MSERDDLVALAEWLDAVWNDDHKRLCEGRNYTCTCGYDEKAWQTVQEVARFHP